MTGPRRQKRPLAYGAGRPFCQELQEPIYQPAKNALAGPAHDAEWSGKVEAQLLHKLRLLFEHYGLSVDKESDWRELAFKLAMDRVPGFAITAFPPKRPGRPFGSAIRHNRVLAEAIEVLALRKFITQSMACTRLVKSKGSPWKGQRHRALYARYIRYLKMRGLEVPAKRLQFLRAQLEEARSAASGRLIEAFKGLEMLRYDPAVSWVVIDPDGTKIP